MADIKTKKISHEDGVDEFEEAVSTALRWYDSRWCLPDITNISIMKDEEEEKTSSPSACLLTETAFQRRLFLDFRHLIIGRGINVEALSARIRAKVPAHVPIFLSFRCCRMEKGGLETMKRFLSQVPNLTFMNVTWLWFDYEEISNVVLAANDLMELELPLGNQPGVSHVLEACQKTRIRGLRFISRDFFLETETVKELLTVLPSLDQVKTLSFNSFQCTDECLDLLFSGLLGLDGVERLQLSCEGGITSASLPIWAKLLRGLPSSTNLVLRMNAMPRLFQEASADHIRDFVSALKEQSSLTRLELDHVGLTSVHSGLLLESFTVFQKKVATASLVGPKILRGKGFGQLLKYLPSMSALQRLAVIDTENDSSIAGKYDDPEEMVAQAVFQNYTLQHLTLHIGEDCIYPAKLDHIFQRNASLAHAHKVVSKEALGKHEFPLGLWAPALFQAMVQGGTHGTDATYVLLHHLCTSSVHHL